MSPQSHLDYTTRSLLMLCATILRRLPNSYNVAIDRDSFLQSFIATPSGTSIRPTRWEVGPNGLVRETRDADGALMHAISEYVDRLYPIVARGNPYLPSAHPGFNGEYLIFLCDIYNVHNVQCRYTAVSRVWFS